jgi:hypothetical protein
VNFSENFAWDTKLYVAWFELTPIISAVERLNDIAPSKPKLPSPYAADALSANNAAYPNLDVIAKALLILN